MTPKTPTGPRFTPRELPDDSAAAYLARNLGAVYRQATARVRIHAPLETVAAMVNDAWGTIEAGDDASCELVVYSTSLTSIARWMHAFDADFTILEPDDLRAECAAVADYHERAAQRYRRAVG